jgi:hypothetical protein
MPGVRHPGFVGGFGFGYPFYGGEGAALAAGALGVAVGAAIASDRLDRVDRVPRFDGPGRGYIDYRRFDDDGFYDD